MRAIIEAPQHLNIATMADVLDEVEDARIKDMDIVIDLSKVETITSYVCRTLNTLESRGRLELVKANEEVDASIKFFKGLSGKR